MHIPLHSSVSPRDGTFSAYIELVRDARQITTPGVEGERTIKTRVYSSNGQMVDRQELSKLLSVACVPTGIKAGVSI